MQWSFRKAGTMGTLASQAEIGFWVSAPAGVCASAHGWQWLRHRAAPSRCGRLGISPRKKNC